MGRYSSVDLRNKIIQYHEQGLTFREIQVLTDACLGTIHKWISRYKTDDSLDTRPKRGRTRKTTEDIDNEIYKLSREDAFKSATEIRQDLQLTSVSVDTVRRRLKEKGLKCRSACVKPVLTASHKQKRLQFALQYREWTVQRWKKVMFSDEKIFRGDGHQRSKVWRHKKQRFLASHLKRLNRHNKAKISVWGTIGAGRNALHLITAPTLAKKYYTENILDEYVPKNNNDNYNDDNGDNDDDEPVVFMYDRSPIHMADMAQRWLENNMVEHTPLPAKSPDMNPIENVWAELERRTKDRRVKSASELWCIIHTEFANLEEEYIDNLIESMPRRMEQVIEARGDWIKY